MKIALPLILFASSVNADYLRFLTGTGYGYDSQAAALHCDAIGAECGGAICDAVSSGCAVAGPAGARGERGPAGPAGANGRDGSNGAAGAAGARGPAGATGATGAAGPRGAAGAAGARGADGARGPAGPAGARGPAGPAGARGPAGAAGPAGRDAPNLNAEVSCFHVSSDNGTGPNGSSGNLGPADGGGSGSIVLQTCQKGFATGASASCAAGYELTGCVGFSTTDTAAIASTCKMNGNACVCGGCLVGGQGNNVLFQAQASCCAVRTY